MTASDSQLLADFVAGDRQAFGEIFTRHQGHLWAVALRICGDPEDAADALQDGLIRGMRGASAFQGRSQVSTWLHRIVTNSAIDIVRSRRPQVAIDDLPADPSTAQDTAAWDATIDLERALAALPDGSRVALYLVDYEGWPVAEVAQVLGIATGTVKSRCARARARLAPLLAGYGNHPDPRSVPSVDDP